MTAIASRRPARINPDTLPVLIVAVALTTGLAASSFALTFAALVDVAAWANVTPRLAWAVPVMLDAAIVVYTLAVLVHRARRERAVTEWASLAGFTGVSVIANAAHAGTIPAQWQAVIGTVVAGLAPVAVLLAVHTLTRLIVAPVPDAADTGAETDTERPTDTDASERTDTTDADDVEPDTDSTPDTDTDDHTPTASAPVADITPVRTTPVAVRRHPAPRPRGGVRAADRREDILQLRSKGLSVRAIAEQVDLGKTAVAKLLQSEDPMTA